MATTIEAVAAATPSSSGSVSITLPGTPQAGDLYVVMSSNLNDSGTGTHSQSAGPTLTSEGAYASSISNKQTWWSREWQSGDGTSVTMDCTGTIKFQMVYAWLLRPSSGKTLAFQQGKGTNASPSKGTATLDSAPASGNVVLITATMEDKQTAFSSYLHGAVALTEDFETDAGSGSPSNWVTFGAASVVTTSTSTAVEYTHDAGGGKQGYIGATVWEEVAGTDITPTGATVGVTSGSLTVTAGSVAITPAVATVSATPSSTVLTYTYPITPAAVTVTAAPGTTVITTGAVGITPDPVTVSVSAASVVITQPVGGQNVDPAGASVSVTPSALTADMSVTPSAITVTAAPGGMTVTTTYPVALTGAAVTAAAQSVTVTATYPISLSGASVGVAPVDLTVTTGSVDITPDAVTVNATAGTVDVVSGVTPAAANVTVASGSLVADMAVTLSGAAVSVAPSAATLTYTYPISLTGGTVTVTDGTVTIDPPIASITPAGPTVGVTPNTVEVVAGLPISPDVLVVSAASGGMVVTTTVPVSLTGEAVNVSAGSVEVSVPGVVPGIGAYSGLSAHEALHQRILFDGNTPPSPSEAPELVRAITGGELSEVLGVLQQAGAESTEIVGALLELTNQGSDTELEEALIRFAESYGY